ncbi:MAG: DUF5060 domain-containing protein [Bacteroidota bacterium]
MAKQLTILLLFIWINSAALAQISRIPYAENLSGEQWQVIDIIFKANAKVDNPFIADFEAKLKGPEGEEMNVPGFYNGGREWILRFSASTVGDWQFTTTSEVKQLNGKSGIITITENQNPEKHGSIVTRAKNPQHFYYEDGTPYLAMAFECDWLFALDYHNSIGTPKTNYLLDLLVANNLNQIVTTVYSFNPGDVWYKDPKLAQHPEHNYGGDLAIFPFLGTNEEPDFSQLNVDFFKQYDRVMEQAELRNIAIHLMIYVWNKGVSWPAAETEADNMYFDFIIKRYQAFSNIIWDVSKEALNNPRCTEEYGLERIQRIRDLDAYGRLVSVHDYGFCRRNADAVDFISIQTWSATLYSDMLSIRNQFKDKPIFNIEHGGYEVSPYEVFPGDYIDPEICVRRNYLINFAGAYGTYYWQGSSWNVIIHNPYEQPDDFIKPKFEYYRHLVDFFKKYPLSSLQPSPRTNSSGYSLTNNQGLYLMFVPKYNYQISVYYKSPMFSEGGTYQWFNVLTGEYGEEIEFTGGNFENPWFEKADAILIRQH